jgi:beta-glucoside operon transcriptional antiterminator
MIRKQYINEYKCAEKIKLYIEKEYHISIGDEEMVYLTVHIKRVTTKNEKEVT